MTPVAAIGLPRSRDLMPRRLADVELSYIWTKVKKESLLSIHTTNLLSVTVLSLVIGCAAVWTSARAADYPTITTCPGDGTANMSHGTRS
jgi:hypothetical protein